LITSCHTVKKTSTFETKSFAPELTMKPNACRFKGEIISIENDKDADTSSVCHKYSCIASVAILEVQACGSSVSQQLMVGDIMLMRFAFTCSPSDKAFPTMKTKYPGLKSGDVFIANAEQRIALGNSMNFVVYDYLVQ
jgi:hypothetical protein